ncbi:unnamed protein product [Choristocarpus tenellus]
MDLLVQVLGTAGVVETLVEFYYVVTQRDIFTQFEETYFLTTGSLELAGEVFALALGLLIVKRHGQDLSLPKIAQLAARDPIHILAHPKGERGKLAKHILRIGFLGVGVSVISLIPWALFLPVWGPFEGDDTLRLALSTVSASSLLVCLFASCGMGSSVHRDNSLFVSAAVLYAVQKIFEVYLLISRMDRLAPSDLGKTLIVFQLTELLSVLVVVLRVVCGSGYEKYSSQDENKAPSHFSAA